ncbi:MAG: hypothetical protein M3512_14110 [Bacteroidota bacterium]|nr:hypothetical protein [Bacteroidota bacterium]
MKILFLFFALASMLLVSCQNNLSEEQLFVETMEIHDAVMPQMQVVYQLKKELTAKRDSLERTASNAQFKNEVEVRIEELSIANEDMMQWMRNFNAQFEGDENISRDEYLQSEKEKIQGVKTKIDLAIQNAQVTHSNMK